MSVTPAYAVASGYVPANSSVTYTPSISVPAKTLAAIMVGHQDVGSFALTPPSITDTSSGGRTWDSHGGGRSSAGAAYWFTWYNAATSSVTVQPSILVPGADYTMRALHTAVLVDDYASAPTLNVTRAPAANTYTTAGVNPAAATLTPSATGSRVLMAYASRTGPALPTALAGTSYSTTAPVSVAQYSGELTGGILWRTATETQTTTPITVGSSAPASPAGVVALEVVGAATNATPTANAGPDQAVEAFATVTLTGSGTDTDGTIASYAWTQTAGPTVTLTGTGATRTFAAPGVLGGTSLTFSLTVTDNGGATSAADTVVVTVAEPTNYRAGSSTWEPVEVRTL